MDIFKFEDYRTYLIEIIKQKDGKSRGYKSYLADQIGCQRAFVSQVLKGDAHFNLEHGEAVARILGLSNEEADFFLLLILYSRAGTFQLRTRFMAQIKSAKDARLVLKNRFKEKDTLSFQDKAEYYSSWLYGAIRVLTTIPRFQIRENIEKYFNVPTEQLAATLDFLISRGLIIEKNSRLIPTEKHLYLGSDTKLVVQHHSNWRMKAVQSLSASSKTDLHFSSVNSLSREDVLKIREVLMQAIENIRLSVKDSQEECLYSFCIDLFEVR